MYCTKGGDTGRHSKKYDINLRELQLHNRLSDQEVSAGQILYIPK
ncbi:LysM peptidoglycan-binding domain-containing protein [Paenibacillus larvae]|nr:LysM peptidoglycan-binding domain-containing protein [Paenibacillus larvae]MDT2238767.1 LysM peptidoglycan-binding domain-containing protein [Paenibacillus larvae]MDT2261751.1 LysM peptidoglycan-binding domain-containing protein [Paenibacillus larvae]MDT2287841.1 LysM peptidoglycan-binding domain-containing protein [Paenibacillus larvae]MDT2294675.1 LysM peptidoglycan-binding domain-containing protein [Paenibacillus larvae]